MAKDRDRKKDGNEAHEGVISIVGSGMRVIGDCEAEGTLRIEGRVEGTVRAGKAVVVGKDGVIVGDINTQDAVIGGRVNGTVTAESRLELQATCVVDGEIRARRIQLEEGGRVNGNVQTGEISAESPKEIPSKASSSNAPGAKDDSDRSSRSAAGSSAGTQSSAASPSAGSQQSGAGSSGGSHQSGRPGSRSK